MYVPRYMYYHYYCRIFLYIYLFPKEGITKSFNNGIFCYSYKTFLLVQLISPYTITNSLFQYLQINPLSMLYERTLHTKATIRKGVQRIFCSIMWYGHIYYLSKRTIQRLNKGYPLRDPI